jgi:hypothetical protein
MPSANDSNPIPAADNVVANIPACQWTAQDVESILRERGWLKAGSDAEISSWLTDAAARLGSAVASASEAHDSMTPDGHKAGRDALADLLSLIFEYDAATILAASRSHMVLTRAGAHTVIRELANRILQGMEIDSDGYKILVESLQEKMGFSGRGLFHPIRLALAGRAGEEQIDSVIPLIDRAARLPFAVPVKSTRQRTLEFCAAMD